jgi:protein-disulfide isomerase
MKISKVILPILLILAVVSCNKVENSNSGSTSGTTSSGNLGSADNSAVVAKVNGVEITDAELTESVKSRLQSLEAQIFSIKRGGLGNLIEDKLIEAEAKKRGISEDALIKAEVTSKIEDPSDAEVQAMYNQYKSRLNGQSLDQARPRLIAQLKSQKQGAVYRNFVSDLRKDSNVKIFMERPRVDVSADDDPFEGPADAPITIIEFSEFQCPYCKRTLATLDKLKETYKGKIKHVFRDFPLSFHKDAPKAAEAAHCAGEQDKYWEYNRKLFDNQRALKVDNLRTYAKEMSLDMSKFNTCLDSGKYASEIQKDMADGQRAGITGTPGYFINGILLKGAQPFEKFAEIIEEELAK